MASYFGEVLPVFSRAVEEFEDDANCVNHLECSVHWNAELLKDVEHGAATLIFADSSTATAFAESYLLDENSECIGIVSTFEKVDFHAELKQHLAILYRLKRDPKVLVFKAQKDILPEQSFGIMSQICERIPKTATFAVLTTQAAVDYKGDTSSPVLRALVTSDYKSNVPCSFIETPNIVSGFPAQVMSHCQIEGRPAVLFVLYMENLYFDSSYINSFKQCFSLPPLSKCTLVDPPTSDDIQKKVNTHAQSFNMYI